MQINQELNVRLKKEIAFFHQYLSVINNKALLIQDKYNGEAEKAKMDFLSFYLDTVVRIISIYAKDTQTESAINQKISSLQTYSGDEKRDTQLCIKKMEDTSNYLSGLCY